MEKIFAKPFIKALDDHTDGIQTMAKNQNSLTDLLTGSANGEIILWDLHHRSPKHMIVAHDTFVQGMTFVNPAAVNLDDTVFLSCGEDKFINMWSVNHLDS